MILFVKHYQDAEMNGACSTHGRYDIPVRTYNSNKTNVHAGKHRNIYMFLRSLWMIKNRANIMNILKVRLGLT